MVILQNIAQLFLSVGFRYLKRNRAAPAQRFAYISTSVNHLYAEFWRFHLQTLHKTLLPTSFLNGVHSILLSPTYFPFCVCLPFFFCISPCCSVHCFYTFWFLSLFFEMPMIRLMLMLFYYYSPLSFRCRVAVVLAPALNENQICKFFRVLVLLLAAVLFIVRSLLCKEKNIYWKFIARSPIFSKKKI